LNGRLGVLRVEVDAVKKKFPQVGNQILHIKPIARCLPTEISRLVKNWEEFIKIFMKISLVIKFFLMNLSVLLSYDNMTRAKVEHVKCKALDKLLSS
jgi:hypothetical protein